MQNRSWIRPSRNTSNLAEDLRANSEITIRKISNGIFYLLFVKTYYIIFDIFYPSLKLLGTIRILLCGNLVYKVEKSKFETSCFPTFIEPIHCINYWFVILYNPKSVNTCKKPTLLITYLYLSRKQQKIDIIVLAEGFKEDLADALMNLILIGFLCILGIQYIWSGRWFSKEMLSMPNLIFRSLIFLSIIYIIFSNWS